MSVSAITNQDFIEVSLLHTQASTRVESALEKSIVFGLMAVLALVAIPYGTVEPWWVSAFNLSVYALGALWLVHTASIGRWTTSNRSIVLPLVAATGFVFMQSLFFSVDGLESRTLFFKVLALALIFILLSTYSTSSKRLNLLVHVVVGVAVVSAVFGIIRYTQQQNEVGFVLPLLRRDSGFAQFVNKNHFALLMEMAGGLVGGLLVGGGVKRNRILFYVAALFLIWSALVLTSSRGGLFTMFGQAAFLTIVFIWTKLRKRRLALIKVVPATLLVVLVLAVSSIWIGGDLLVTRLESLSGEIRTEASDPHAGVRRREVWGATLDLFKSHPIVGSGFGAYPTAITKFHKANGNWTPEAAHNDYLELLASGGVVGVVLLAWFTIVFGKAARRQLRSTDVVRRAVCLGALTGIFGVVAHSAVDFGIHVTVNAVMLIVLIVLATQPDSIANLRFSFADLSSTNKSTIENRKLKILPVLNRTY